MSKRLRFILTKVMSSGRMFYRDGECTMNSLALSTKIGGTDA